MRNPKYCKPFLERVLGIKISRIEYPKSQETLDLSVDAKSVRLDIYVEDDFTRELDKAIQSVRQNERWRLDYMTLEMNYREKYEQGMEQGMEQGIEREMRQSAMRMLEDGDLPLEKIAIYSGLTLQQVMELEKELQSAKTLNMI